MVGGRSFSSHEEMLRKNAHVDFGNGALSRAELLTRIANAKVILSKTDPVAIDAELMDAPPNLRLVVRHGTGYSNVDIDHATKKGIAVSITAGVNTVAISEYTIGLMLSAARCIPQASAACAAGAPERHQFLGVQITGKTFGIVGVGRIGRAVVERVAALGMKVLAYHPRPSAKELADLPLELVDLDVLLSQSDVVSLHLPLTPDTKDLIGKDELALMKPRAILLNLSRGGVVNEAALFEGLSQKRIFSAATDVLANEPVWADEPLLTLITCYPFDALTRGPLRYVVLCALRHDPDRVEPEVKHGKEETLDRVDRSPRAVLRGTGFRADRTQIGHAGSHLLLPTRLTDLRQDQTRRERARRRIQGSRGGTQRRRNDRDGSR